MKSPMAVRNPNTSGETEKQKDEFNLLEMLTSHHYSDS